MRISSNSSEFFTLADRACDYIPFISTISNCIDLFQKFFILPHIKNQNIFYNNRYYEYLNKKNTIRSIILFIPVIGNIIIVIHDLHYKKQKREALIKIRMNGLAIQYVSEALKSDKEVALAPVQQNGLAIQYVSEALKNDKEIALAAVQQNGLAIQYVSEALKNDKEVALAAVQQNGLAIQYVSEALKDDINIATKIIMDPIARKYLSDEVQKRAEETYWRLYLFFTEDKIQELIQTNSTKNRNY